MLYHFSLVGGARQDREYYSNILRARSKGTQIGEENSLRRKYDIVSIETLLKNFGITLIRRPIHWDEYSAGDDPC